MSARLPSRRRRFKPVQNYTATAMTFEEERLLKQAIENSKKMTKLSHADKDLNIPLGPIFYPTVEEFEGNPLHYINKIRPIAEKYGICKIVPPAGWDPPFSVDMESEQKFQTKEQLLHRIQEGISFGDGEEYNSSTYLKMATEKTREWIAANVKDGNGDPSESATLEFLEKSYWSLVEISHEKYFVEYGNDVDSHEFGSGFPRSDRGKGIEDENAEVPRKIDPKVKELPEPKFGTEEFYKESYWNLNNIPNCPDSILGYIKVAINGINVPWMYYGNLFSTFCWHNEDNYLYSINYHHWGAPKIWYGVPGTETDAAGLEQVFKSYLSMKMRDVPDFLHHITTMFSPRLLQTAEVPVYKLVQHPGEFVVTFPMAFHGGFSTGPNCGEAVNFATHDWISHGAGASERYRSFARPAVFSQDRLTFTMANHLKEQKSFHTCKLLMEELKRVIDEEMRLRNKLKEEGVRDVTEHVKLPENKVDQLDEESADYDDKRLCHSCKHICFFSCVACQCSKSKVSCLRHSHYMCRCAVENRYMMVWSTEKEMKRVYEGVKKHAGELESKLEEEGVKNSKSERKEQDGNDSKAQAPGISEDAKRHRNYKVDLSESSPLCKLPRTGQNVLIDLMSFAKRKLSEVSNVMSDVMEKKQVEKKVEKSTEGGQGDVKGIQRSLGTSLVSVDSGEDALAETKVLRIVSEERI